MSNEPEWLFQSGAPLTDEQRMAWFEARTAEAKSEGCAFGRYSLHETIPNLILFEGWRTQPKDQGPVRWQMVAA